MNFQSNCWVNLVNFTLGGVGRVGGGGGAADAAGAARGRPRVQGILAAALPLGRR